MPLSSRSFSRIPSTVPISERRPFAVQKCLALPSEWDLYRLQFLEHVRGRQDRASQTALCPLLLVFVFCCWCLMSGWCRMLVFLLL